MKMSTIEDYAIQGVAEWYAGKNLFISGGTGFMGKVLVEKILRDCPEIKSMYLLVRSKKGVEAEARKEEYFKCVVFDKVREINPKLMDKVKFVKGDVMSEDLGISVNDHNELISNIDVIFHCAANVRFDQPLRPAIEMNAGGTLRMLQLAEKISQLKVFVHVSTSYCHCKEDVLEERSYPPPHDPLAILQMTRTLDDKFLEQITPKLLNGLPNTYAYSKAITEGLVSSYGSKIPIVVCRPSIVTASKKEPFPGWVEGMNGPTGLMIGAARGIIRTMHCNPDYPADIIPVDTAINAIIIAAWDRGQTKSEITEFYNVTLSHDIVSTWGENLETGKRIFYENPLCFSLWYPDGSIKSNYYKHLLCVILFHYLPAYFIDSLLFLFGQKPFLIKVQKKVSMGLKVLQYYTTKHWIFKNDKLEKLKYKLTHQDQEIFDFTVDQINWEEYFYDYIIGLRVYLLKEGMETLPQARKVLRRLYIADKIVTLIFYTLIFWLLWSNMDYIWDSITSIFSLSSKLFTKQTRYVLDH